MNPILPDQSVHSRLNITVLSKDCPSYVDHRSQASPKGYFQLFNNESTPESEDHQKMEDFG
jgi:hypothetical protein